MCNSKLDVIRGGILSCVGFACPAGAPRSTHGADCHDDRPIGTAVVRECGAATVTISAAKPRKTFICQRRLPSRARTAGGEHRSGRSGKAGAGSCGTAPGGSGTGTGGNRNGIELEPFGGFAKRRLGLMQLIPTTAQRFGVNDAFSPKQNVDAGVRYLKTLLERYNGNLDLALAAYNAGEGAVDRAHGDSGVTGKLGIMCSGCRRRTSGQDRDGSTVRIHGRIRSTDGGAQRTNHFHE